MLPEFHTIPDPAPTANHKNKPFLSAVIDSLCISLGHDGTPESSVVYLSTKLRYQSPSIGAVGGAGEYCKNRKLQAKLRSEFRLVMPWPNKGRLTGAFCQAPYRQSAREKIYYWVKFG
jgi:hypothetical protein